MTDYVRGQTIRFTTSFEDADGVAHTPVGPTITINYPVENGQRASTSIALQGGPEWVAEWDSGEAGRAGTVYWTVYSGSPDPKIANDGSFSLTANTSNLVAV